MLVGAGQVYYTTRELAGNSFTGGNIVLPQCIGAVEITPDTQLAEAFCLAKEGKVLRAAAITQSTFTVNITYEYADWGIMQIAFNEIAKPSAAVLPTLKLAAVESAKEITDADVTVASASQIMAYLASGALPRFLKKVTTAPASADEFQVTAGKLVFHSTMPTGAEVQYTVPKAFSAIESIGALTDADRQTFGELSLNAIMYGPGAPEGIQLIIDRLYRTSIPSLTLSGQLAELSLEFRAGTLPGRNLPFRLYNLASGVV